MYGERFGVFTSEGVIAWFFDLYVARENAKTWKAEGWKVDIFRGILHNDCGCTPWIEKLGLIETM